jgi:uncharacterized protein YutE (UPF0331/DUF86 family)
VSEDAWIKRFKPSTINSTALKEAVDLSYQKRYELVFLTIFKAIEAEAKRLLKTDFKEKPDKILGALQESGLVSECEFHFLNGLRVLRNEVAHGYPEESHTIDKLFVQNELKIGILLAILLLMHLQSKHNSDTVQI